uniref:peptidylprolyl isomerase n=1 Tax=Globisporangium ultimum (strain ATCC 200006 / CBS 805.95 / DAOM BR144) TaxID=431595 RepID=K3WGR8_GLOUD
MSDVRSMSSSPSSAHSHSSSLGNSLTWENVTLSPFEVLSIQLDHELQHAQDSFARPKQNKNGIDVNKKTNKADGRVVVRVVAAQGLKEVLAQNPVLGNATQEPLVYVSTMSTKKHLRTAAVSFAADSDRACWNEVLVYEGVKAKNFTLKVGIQCSGGILADIVLGEVEISSKDYLDQLPHDKWVDLKAPASAIAQPFSSTSHGKVLLRITFEYDAFERHERRLAALIQKKKENDESIELFRKTAPLVKAQSQHPAAYGTATTDAGLYIPGNRFRIEAHHPGAVSVTPLPDKTRIVTPFGRGVVIAFRKETKMYVVQLDTDVAARNPSLAYLRQDIVKEETNEPRLRMYMKVATPYGLGTIDEVRSHDEVIVVKTDYARMFMQKKDVKIPEKSIEEMSTKDLIAESIKLTDAGNEQFRNNSLEEAIYSYLRSLGYLQRVDQDGATHKEKATMLQTMIRCHLNIGACKLKLDAYYDAEIACTNALSILTVLAENRHGNVVTWMGRLGLSDQVMFEEWPSKARFRRAQACFKLGKYADAKQDLLIAAKLSPKDKSCRALLDRVTKLLNEQKNQERKTWGGIFESGTEEEVDASLRAIQNQNRDAAAAVGSTETTAASAASAESSIFTRKTKLQRQREAAKKKAAALADEEPWYLSRKALATASLVTAGVAAVTLLALKQQQRS